MEREVLVDGPTTATFVDGEVLVGEVDDAASEPPAEEEFIDGVVLNDNPGRWFPRA